MFFRKDFQKGQAILVIVLIMVVTLTIGLSLATRSIVNTRISSEENESQKAFSAAEAGVERLLSENPPTSPGTVNFVNNTTYTTTSQDLNAASFLFNGGNPVLKGEGVDLWLANTDFSGGQWPPTGGTGSFRIYWKQSADSCTSTPPTAAAVEIVVLYGADKNSPKAYHYTADPCTGAGSRSTSNNFNNPTAPTISSRLFGGITLTRYILLSFGPGQTIPESGFLVRIIPLYNSAVMGFVKVTGPAIPVQGKNVESLGTSGETARKISVFQSNPRLPTELFPYVIFSPNN